jgi:hypothetical protein
MSRQSSSNESAYLKAETSNRREALREKLESAAQRVGTRGAIGETLAVNDTVLLERIHALGFTGDSARVFDLLPLVFVSWADGKIQHGERVTILELLSSRGIEPGSDAALLMETLLEQRPSESFIAETLTVLQAMTSDRLTDGGSVVDWCLEVARASGGLFGLGEKTSIEERALIEQIAAALGETAEQRFRERLGDP